MYLFPTGSDESAIFLDLLRCVFSTLVSCGQNSILNLLLRYKRDTYFIGFVVIYFVLYSEGVTGERELAIHSQIKFIAGALRKGYS